MYSSYSPLQRRQLREQTYTDTQSTYLLVYAPGRRNALTLSLAEQLHRKFRLVDRLEGELTPSVNGVLLVSEDVECTSTALTYFAAALQQGADLVVCDAVFGYDGGSALYQTDQHLSGQRCALLSRALLDRCRAAARGKDDVLELLRLAIQLAQNCRCVPQALLHFRRELCAEDVFSAFVNSKQLFHFSYQRYLINQIRENFGLEHTPIRLVIRERGSGEVGAKDV